MFFLFKGEGWAQNEIDISNSILFNSPDGFDLTNCPAYIDSSKQLNTKQIETKEFKTLDFTNALNAPFAFGKQNVWFQLVLHNQGKDSIQAIVLSNRCDILSLYIPENDPNTPRDFANSHLVKNYGWIFKRTPSQTGYVKKRK